MAEVDTSKFCEEAIQSHNVYRSRHGANSLKLSPRLCNSAQDWAEKLLNMSILQNSNLANQGEVGENISMRRGSDVVDISGHEVSDQWYNDISKYDFHKGTGEAGNFTQLVWLQTTEVGFGKARSVDGTRCIVVAHYNPPGNVIGLYVANVRPPHDWPGANTEVSNNVEVKDLPKVGGDLPQGRERARVSVHSERGTSPGGSQIYIRKIVKEYLDEHGRYVRNTKEVHFRNEHDAVEYEKVHRESSPSEASSEDEDERLHLGPISIDLKRKKRENTKFRNSVLRLHNRYRKIHGVDRLHRSKQLEESAQKWAEYLLTQPNLSNSNQMHKNMRVGENIASRRSNAPCDYSADEVVDHWYLEHNKFQHGVEPHDVQGIGNFTQLVWRNTREIGVGKASSQDPNTGATRVVVVCHYFPAGNVLTQFVENVPPAHFSR